MVQPEYTWYKDGAFDAYLVGEKIDPKKVTKIAGPTETRLRRQSHGRQEVRCKK